MSVDWTSTSPDELLKTHLNRATNTSRAYECDVRTFAAFLGVERPVDAVSRLTNMAMGAARRTLHDYLAWMRERFYLSTARRRLGCIRGLLRLAHEYGIIPWAIVNMPLPSPTPQRDTRGPDRADLERIIAYCQQRADAKGGRDLAMVRMMGVCGYRKSEVRTLDVKHVDLDKRSVQIAAKGSWGTGRQSWPIDIRTAEAVGHWLELRGLDDGPLFTTLQRGRVSTGERLSETGFYDVVVDLGKRVGLRSLHPHALRHTAATEFMRLTNGNVAWAMALTRHKDPKTVMVYNDAARPAREAMEIVAGGIPIYRYRGHGDDNS